jgi:hypothetical protein
MFYRLKQWYHYNRFKSLTGILSSPPTACDPEAACAVHTMLSARDIPLYLAAIKSFLRFYPSVAVVVHSDGSLSTPDEVVLCRHVPGCKVISTSEADARAHDRLAPDSLLSQWRARDASYRRVIDTELWASTPKRIIMDSDMLALRSPSEIIDWIEQGRAPFLLGQPDVPSGPLPATGRKHIQAIFRENVTALSRLLGLPDHFPQGATSGFYGCAGGELALPQLERTLKACLKLGIPMHEWGGEQCIVIYLLAAAGARRLHPELYLNFHFDLAHKVGEAHVVHFLGYCRFHKNLYPNRAARVVHDLTHPSLAPA